MELLIMGTAGIVGSVAAAVVIAVLVQRIAGANRAPPRVPVELPKVLPAEVVTALAAGRKIDAIKAYRAATGCDLLTAKQVCDAIEAGTAPPR